MTATERLRQLLDDRGVVWGNRFAGEPQSSYTRYEVDSGMSVTAWEDTLTGKLGLSVEIDYRLTPEQAVDATLGCEPNDKEMLRLHDRLNVALLRLERNVDNGNERIAAIAEAHELLEDAATLGRGTCHIVKTWSDSDYVGGWRYRCSECGSFIPVDERNIATGDPISHANFCPNCGRRVVNEQ